MKCCGEILRKLHRGWVKPLKKCTTSVSCLVVPNSYMVMVCQHLFAPLSVVPDTLYYYTVMVFLGAGRAIENSDDPYSMVMICTLHCKLFLIFIV